MFGNNVCASINANCIGDTIETYSILQFRQPKHNTYTYDTYQNSQELEVLLNIVNSINLSYIQENILYYISGTIIHIIEGNTLLTLREYFNRKKCTL